MTLLVDSSVWIDYFNGEKSWQTDYLDDVLGWEPILVGDLILTEVLQGFKKEADFKAARHALTRFPIAPLVTPDRAVQSAVHYRFLREKGITIRKTIDCWIATFCIATGTQLLHDDRDFEPFAENLGLNIKTVKY